MTKRGKEKSKGNNIKLTQDELERRQVYMEELEASGELERMRLKLYAQLVMNDEWEESMQQKVRDVVQKSGGVSEVTLDELVSNITKHGKEIIPESIRMDTLTQIQSACNMDFPTILPSTSPPK